MVVGHPAHLFLKRSWRSGTSTSHRNEPGRAGLSSSPVALVDNGRHEPPEPDDSGWNAPTIDDLNGDTEREFDWTGVRNNTGEDLARLESGTEAEFEVAQSDGERLRELGIRRMMVMDVRDGPVRAADGGGVDDVWMRRRAEPVAGWCGSRSEGCRGGGQSSVVGSGAAL